MKATTKLGNVSGGVLASARARLRVKKFVQRISSFYFLCHRLGFFPLSFRQRTRRDETIHNVLRIIHTCMCGVYVYGWLASKTISIYTDIDINCLAVLRRTYHIEDMQPNVGVKRAACASIRSIQYPYLLPMPFSLSFALMHLMLLLFFPINF